MRRGPRQGLNLPTDAPSAAGKRLRDQHSLFNKASGVRELRPTLPFRGCRRRLFIERVPKNRCSPHGRTRRGWRFGGRPAHGVEDNFDETRLSRAVGLRALGVPLSPRIVGRSSSVSLSQPTLH